ncbi:MAG: ABC transporter permease [Candidatus Sumerlaeota bacterium]|nr:ABC transporter permease [Candidatus Sumerlaeota bacterium]
MTPILARRIFILGLMNIWRRPLRSFLTILGIVFGVCSVIAMLAIGEGASYEAQEQIKRLGSQNIIIRSVKPPQNQDVSQQTSFMIDYGLTYKDAECIQAMIPGVEVIVSERSIRADLIYRRTRLDANVVGTVPWFPRVTQRTIKEGRFFNEEETEDARNVCVLGEALANRLFPGEDPIGKSINAKGDVYRVVGVLKDLGAMGSSTPATQFDLYVPLTAVRLRYGDIITNRSSGSFSAEKVELNEIIARVQNVNQVLGISDVIRGILDRRHRQADYEMIVPLELLYQAQRTKRIFSIVLGSIAAISLLVGGIGIMNIMLASVTERTREIGIRRALGAKRKDIIFQFLTETILLSGCGGLFGLAIGVLIPFLITYYAEMRTIVRLWSLGGALGISLMIGLVFGIYPAWRASRMNPIQALRHE